MGDISTTKTFVSGETDCDYDDFNEIIGGASINATFVSGKTGVTPDGANDYVLGWDATDAALKKFLVNNLTNINSQTDMAAVPANDDYALVWDTDVAALRKVVMTNFVPVDDSTLTRDATTRPLIVKDAGITEDHLNASVAGDGLAGGAGTALSVNVDDASIEIATDTLQVKAGGITDAMLKQDLIGDMDGATVASTDLIPFGDADDSNNIKTDSVTDVVAAGITARRYSVGSIACASTMSKSTHTHGLGAIPTRIRVVLVCGSADLNYAAGDELEASQVIAKASGGLLAFQWHADASNIYLIQSGSPYAFSITSNAATPVVDQAIDKAKWTLKIYAEL